jgi:tetratricopeptide (TPR) repeat protein
MNKEQFIKYLSNPEMLNSETVNELTMLVDDFPYFQSARILLTINLFKDKSIRYNSELKVAAVYAGSRNVLKKHIDRAAKDRVIIVVDKEKKEEEIKTEQYTDDTKSMTTEKINGEQEELQNNESKEKKDTEREKVSSSHKEVTTEEDTISQLKKIIEKRIREIEEEKKGESANLKSGKEKNEKLKKKKSEIIDEFIKKEPAISRPKATFYDPVESAKQSVVDQENIISETLAKIYYDQRYFEKAIKMYEKLILKYPEKSSYFAALIEKCNNELNKKQ